MYEAFEVLHKAPIAIGPTLLEKREVCTIITHKMHISISALLIILPCIAFVAV
jgi:hypothetical protein